MLTPPSEFKWENKLDERKGQDMQEKEKKFKSCLTNHSSKVEFVLFCFLFLGVFVYWLVFGFRDFF